jgi:D-alanyl-lipoteichoic acid acyltransferase DltB (MBOAT superfamily)
MLQLRRVCRLRVLHSPVPTPTPAADLYFLSRSFASSYIAGPIVSFNAFIRSLEQPQAKHTPMQLFIMLARVCAYALLLDILLHYQFYYNININRLFAELHPLEVAWAGYFTLNFMYLKFTIIWRLFRVWALFDGVDAGENMLRCVNNNYTFAGFWRQWHATLNKWILRYIYVPLGGSSSQAWSMWVIFSFVGLWHDLWWRWLAWAWINCCCFSLELLVQHIFTQKIVAHISHSPRAVRIVVAAGGAINIMLLMCVSLHFNRSLHLAVPCLSASHPPHMPSQHARQLSHYARVRGLARLHSSRVPQGGRWLVLHR